MWVSSRPHPSHLLLLGLLRNRHQMVTRCQDLSWGALCCLFLKHRLLRGWLCKQHRCNLSGLGGALDFNYSNQSAWLPCTRLHKLFPGVIVSPKLISCSDFWGFSHALMTVEAQGDQTSKVDVSAWFPSAGQWESPPPWPLLSDSQHHRALEWTGAIVTNMNFSCCTHMKSIWGFFKALLFLGGRGGQHWGVEGICVHFPLVSSRPSNRHTNFWF